MKRIPAIEGRCKYRVLRRKTQCCRIKDYSDFKRYLNNTKQPAAVKIFQLPQAALHDCVIFIPAGGEPVGGAPQGKAAGISTYDKFHKSVFLTFPIPDTDR